MGFNTYYVSSVKEKTGTPIPLDYSKAVFSSISPLAKVGVGDMSAKFVRNFEIYGCREFMVNGVGIHSYIYGLKTVSGFIGIRCFSSVYSIVAELISRSPSYKKKLEGFFLREFGIELEIFPEKYNGKEKTGEFPTFTQWTIQDNSPMDISWHLTVYFSSWHKKEEHLQGSFLSFVLGMLREKYIIQKILTNKIKSRKDLILAYIHLAKLRYNKTDKSYFQVKFCSYADRTMETYWEKIADMLKSGQNGDGSGYADMVFTAMYIMYREMHGNFSQGLGDGPSYVVQNLSVSSQKRLAKEIFEICNRNQRAFLELISEISLFKSIKEELSGEKTVSVS
jgi:hypothetical protein